MLPRALAVAVIVLVSLLEARAAAAPPRSSAREAAEDVYERVVVPCCWTQTLDVHESELATELRVEIAARLRSGERALAIEDDLAARYGERVRAVPRGNDTRRYVGSGVFGLLIAALLGLSWRAYGWVQKGRAREQDELQSSSSLSSDDPPADYDELLDRELRELDRAG
jgi:cytochrome c-type biogenesis protein CcmH